MICNNQACEYFDKETDTIAMLQVSPTESYVYDWHEKCGLGENKDEACGELPSEHDADSKRSLPYIYRIECNHCGEVLIDF